MQRGGGDWWPPQRDEFRVQRDLTWLFDDDGMVWRRDGKQTTPLPLPENSPVLAFWADEQRAWAATSLRTFEWDGARWQGRPGPSAGAIVGLAAHDEVFAITSEGALVRWSNGAWRDVVRLVPPPSRFAEQLVDVRAEGDAGLWVTTSRGRLLHWNGTNVSVFDSGAGLSLGKIHEIKPDAIWFEEHGDWVQFRRP